jgi:uncharacterized membrane protein YbhN (UPF0104 family)
LTRGAVVRWLVGLAVSGVFLWLAFRSIDLHEVGREIAGADQAFLLPAVTMTTLSYVLRGIRWRLCFAASDPVDYAQASAGYSVGAAGAQVLPSARLGDLVRVYVLGQVSPVSKGKALGTLLIERLADMIAVVIMLTVLLPMFSLPSWIKVFDGFGAVLAIVVLVVVFLLAQRGQTLPEPVWIARRPPLHVLFGLVLQVLDGFSAVKDPRRGLLIMLVSLAVWVAQTGTYAISFSAVHIPLGWKEGALTTMVLALTAIIPSGPGFAGTFELVTQTLLGLFNTDATLATAYQEYTRIVTLLSVVVYLALAWLALKLWTSARSQREPGAEPLSTKIAS